jgi:hypothetical protein
VHEKECQTVLSFNQYKPKHLDKLIDPISTDSVLSKVYNPIQLQMSGPTAKTKDLLSFEDLYMYFDEILSDPNNSSGNIAQLLYSKVTQEQM